GPFRLVVKGNNTITFNNVLVGEVWICSGQSNMAFQVKDAVNADQEMAASNFHDIRQVYIPNTIAAMPEKDIEQGEWKICTPQKLRYYKDVVFFFKKKLYNQLKFQIGLKNT